LDKSCSRPNRPDRHIKSRVRPSRLQTHVCLSLCYSAISGRPEKDAYLRLLRLRYSLFQKSRGDVSHLPRNDFLTRGLNTHGGRLDLRREQRRHADLPHQGVDRGGAAAMGHGSRASKSQGYPSDGIWFVRLYNRSCLCIA